MFSLYSELTGPTAVNITSETPTSVTISWSLDEEPGDEKFILGYAVSVVKTANLSLAMGQGMSCFFSFNSSCRSLTITNLDLLTEYTIGFVMKGHGEVKAAPVFVNIETKPPGKTGRRFTFHSKVYMQN